MPPPGKPLAADAIAETARGFMSARILLSAFELGIFDALGDGAKTSDKVARLVNADIRATDRLLRALAALGFVETRGASFANTAAGREALVSTSPAFMGGTMHWVNMWDAWSHLTDAVRRGSSPKRPDINDRDEGWRRAFIAAMHANGRRSAAGIVQAIGMSGVRRVLDVGGGSGAYAMAFCAADPQVSATVFDLPNITPLTREYIAAAGMEGRVDTADGSFLTDDLGKGYDLVFVSAIVHMLSPGKNAALIRKCAEAANAGGRVVVQDFIMDEDRLSPAGGAVFALNMLVGTECGDTYTENEVRGWMEAAGLGGVTRKDTGAGTALVTGTKA
jgi:predicted O-methyltransferase YrrM